MQNIEMWNHRYYLQRNAEFVSHSIKNLNRRFVAVYKILL
jgi:hypothetical protein